MSYAVIGSSGSVVNTIVYNEVDTWDPPIDCIAVEIPTDVPVSIGWTYIDGEFIPPA